MPGLRRRGGGSDDDDDDTFGGGARDAGPGSDDEGKAPQARAAKP